MNALSVRVLGVCHMSDFFDDADGNCAIVVTQDDPAHRWDLTENLHRHQPLRNQGYQCCIALTEILGTVLNSLTCFLVDLCDNVADETVDSRCVAKNLRSVPSLDLTWCVHDDDLRNK